MVQPRLPESFTLPAEQIPTPRRRHATLAVAIALLTAFAGIAPFAAIQLPRSDGFIPFLHGLVFVNNLATAVLLVTHFSLNRSRGVLALAGGYLYSALIVIPYTLLFPRSSASDLFGAGLQSPPWLYDLWHIGFSVAVLAYAWLRDLSYPVDEPAAHLWQIITRSACTVILGVTGLTFFSIVEKSWLPIFLYDETHFTPLAWYASISTITLNFYVLIQLWNHRRLALDYWLLVMMLATIMESGLIWTLTDTRFSVGFYAGRIFMLAASMVILLALIAERMNLDARLDRSRSALRRERSNLLTSAAAVSTSIAHELRQPLMAIAMNSSAALRHLRRQPIDNLEIHSAMDDIIREEQRTNRIFEGIRNLFNGENLRLEIIDLNETIRSALLALQHDLERSGIRIQTELCEDLPTVFGHRRQLQHICQDLIINVATPIAGAPATNRTILLRTFAVGNSIVATIDGDEPGSDRLLDVDSPGHVRAIDDDTAGLSVAVCRMIIRHHGGQLEVCAGRPAANIAFRITLPADVSTYASAHTAAPPALDCRIA